MKSRVQNIATAGVIAAVYTVLTYVLQPISFNAWFQIRVAESLAVLPFLTGAAIPGLYIGCLVSNAVYSGGLGLLDIIVGPLLTLAAAVATFLIRRWFGATRTSKVLALLPPVLFNAFGVSAYLAPVQGVSYWFAVLMIGVGQLISCYVIGLPLLILMEKRKIFN